MVASANLLNLALPGRRFYPNQEPYGDDEYQRKLRWLGALFKRLNPDLMGVQEVWDEAALKAAVAASGQQGWQALVPGAEQGAQGTPRVGLVTRLPVLGVQSHADFGPGLAVPVPELGAHTRFERPVLHARLQPRHGPVLHVLVCHLKSKRPKFLQDASGQPLEDRDDPRVIARASLRSLVMRGAEAAALRELVIAQVQHTRAPLLLLGDLNDGPHAVTSQLIAATDAAAHDRGLRDVALYHAWDVQTEPALRRDMAYSHVHQGWPELLDQVWVSEEFVASSRHALGDVRRVEVFNDHLHEGRDRSRSDHGFVRALLRFKLDQPPNKA
jgi:endonuclease/exonuclease/phosphatase family metal-dependent hydrolase